MLLMKVADGPYIDLDDIKVIDTWQDSEWYGLFRTKLRHTDWAVRVWTSGNHGPYIFCYADDKAEALLAARDLAAMLNERSS